MKIQNNIACIGECMIELNETPNGDLSQSFGGDTLNTCLYAARLGKQLNIDTSYITGLGDDPYSTTMITAWQGEGIKCDHVTQISGKLPGLYAIKTDAVGERSFYYWRDQAAARELLQQQSWDLTAVALKQFQMIYLSGISVSILPKADRQTLLTCLKEAQRMGAKIAFDINYRPRGWEHASAAVTALTPFLEIADILLPGLDDIVQLFGCEDAKDALALLVSHCAGEICLKDGVQGAYGRVENINYHQPAINVPSVVDTTAAGDSFNAGYLTGRLSGMSPQQSAGLGAELAARVVSHQGAIIPIDAMQDLL